MGNNEDWSDVPEATGLGGIFGGEGLSEFNSVRTKLDPNGLHVFTRCERCGKQPKLLVSFVELMFIAKGREAPEWWYDKDTGLMRWRRGCSCSEQVRPYPFGLTPGECTQALTKAIQYHYISQQQAQQMEQHVASTPAAR
jgi:hypothetical protein